MQIAQQNTSLCTRILDVIVSVYTDFNHCSDDRAIGAGRPLSVALLWAIRVLQHPGNEPAKRQKKEAEKLNFIGTEI